MNDLLKNNYVNCMKILGERPRSALLISKAENLFYFSGIEGLEGKIIITGNGNYCLITDSRYEEVALGVFGEAHVRVVNFQKGAYAHIREFCGNDIRTLFFEEDDLSVSGFQSLKAHVTTPLSEGGSKILRQLRMQKHRWEIENIIKAQRIAEDALMQLLMGDDIHTGVTERELAIALDYYMAKLGSEKPSFDTILLSGPNTSLPHGKPSNRKIQPGDPILIDFGATYNGYHSDMTRTFVYGEPSEKFKQVYKVVLDAQQRGIEALRVGKSTALGHKVAESVIATAGFTKYFGHAFGHGVGLEIHEHPSVSPASKEILSEGNIVTAEPGIYLPNRFGIRIEDMLAVIDGKIIDITQTAKELFSITVVN